MPNRRSNESQESSDNVSETRDEEVEKTVDQSRSDILDQRRSDSEDRVKHTLYLPRELSTRLKLEKVRTGDEMSEIVSRALEHFLDDAEKRRGV